MRPWFLAPFLALFVATAAAIAQPPVILTVQADKPGAAISPTMWGVFFEDVNCGADGGLYPERVKNRSFEFPDPLMGWHAEGTQDPGRTVTVRDDGEQGSNNRHYVAPAIHRPLRGLRQGPQEEASRDQARIQRRSQP